MAKKKLEGFSLESLKATAVPATPMEEKRTRQAAKGRGPGSQLTVIVPEALLKELKVKAATENTTLRTLVLEALHKAGYKVGKDELRDRRGE